MNLTPTKKSHRTGSVRGRLGRPLAVSMTLSAVLLSACGGGGNASDGDTEKLKVAVLYADEIEDDYNKAFQEGVLDALAELGADEFELTEVKSVPYTEQVTQVTSQLFAQGTDVVIDGLGGAGTLFYDACKQFPDKTCISYYATSLDDMPENTWGFYAKPWQQKYLEGVAAGLLTDTDTLGWVGSYEATYDYAALNSFLLGCQSVNPACEARVIYLNSFFDPPAARSAATALLKAGADVIHGYHGDASVLQVAQQNGAWGYGFYRPMQKFGPDAYVTSWLLPPIVSAGLQQGLQAVQDGTFESGFEFLDGYTLLDSWGEKVPEAVRAEVADVLKKMEAGEKFLVGPIKDNAGEVRVQEGEEPSDLFLYEEWDWQVQGVLK